MRLILSCFGVRVREAYRNSRDEEREKKIAKIYACYVEVLNVCEESHSPIFTNSMPMSYELDIVKLREKSSPQFVQYDNYCLYEQILSDYETRSTTKRYDML